MSMTASMMTREEFLEHYGVKGMKWGVLRGQAASGDKRAKKALARADRDWDKELRSVAGWVKVNNAVADKANGPEGYIAKLNANPAYKDVKDFTDYSDPKVKAYWKEANEVSTKNWNETLVELYGESPSGRYKIEAVKSDDGSTYMDVVDTQSISHAETVDKLRIYLVVSPIGRPLGVKLLDEGGILMHMNGMMTEGEFLEHYGVKGMKWGQNSKGESLRALDKIARAENKLAPKREARKQEARPSRSTFASKEDFVKAKAEFNKKRNSDIDAARERINSGQNRADYKQAKAKYKEDRNEIGKVAAKRALTAVKEKNLEDYYKSREAKSGAETVGSIMVSAANLALTVLR